MFSILGIAKNDAKVQIGHLYNGFLNKLKAHNTYLLIGYNTLSPNSLRSELGAFIGPTSLPLLYVRQHIMGSLFK